MTPITIAVITDIHHAAAPTAERPHADMGLALLRRAVHRLHRLIKPDAVAILGDVLHEPAETETDALLTEVKAALEPLACPVIVLPGNHDPDPERFYRVLPRPPEWLDVGPVRLVPFIDPPEPEYNARRRPEDLDRMLRARQGHAGPLVMLQHVPVLPPGRTECPYTYTNLADVLDRVRRAGVTACVGGHFHRGTPPVVDGGCTYVCAHATRRDPYPITLLRIDGDHVDVTASPLASPRELGLVDCHSHTQFSYCGINVTMTNTPRMAAMMGLAGLAFTEHTGQLYFDRDTFWKGAFCPDGIDGAKEQDSRMAAYWAAAEEAREAVRAAGLPLELRVGLEADADFLGRAVVRPEDRRRAEILLGVVHYLPEMANPQPDLARARDEFLAVVEGLCRDGIQILGHPTRIFRKHKDLPIVPLYRDVVALLRRYGVAAEINCHHQDPDPRFIRMCLDAGVRLSFGSDAHDVAVVGEFAMHLAALRAAGYDGEVGDVLFRPEPQP